MDTGPKNNSEKITFVNVSENKINHIFSDNGNPTITMIAKIFFVLGEECNLVCKGDKNA